MDYTDLDAALREIVGEAQVRADEPLAEHTTFRIGGAAQWLVLPSSEDEVAAVVAAPSSRAFSTPLKNCL